MTKVQAYQKYIRVSPRKLKVLVDSIKDMGVDDILTNLKFTNKKTARILYKVLQQATSNAKQKQVDLKKWHLDAIQVFKGPTYKRWRAVSRGRGHSLLKRTSHLKVVLRLEEDILKKSNDKITAPVLPRTKKSDTNSTKKTAPNKQKGKINQLKEKLSKAKGSESKK